MAMEKFTEVSERRICRIIGQPRSTQRYQCSVRDDENQLVADIIRLVKQYGRYGYRRITGLLQADGWWRVNHKRVERLWRREGLKVPQKQPKKRRLWFNDGSCIRLRPTHKNHVWSYDFVHDRTSNGRAIRMLTIIDEYSRECLAIEVDRKLNSKNVIDVLSRLFIEKGIPEHIRSDNGPEFIAHRVRCWLKRQGVQTLYIEPGSPWENGYIESFNGKLRDELLDGEIFDTLYEAKVLVERWRWEYNTIRPHSSLGYKPPAPEAIQPRWIEKSTSNQHNYWYN
jgi:transposase InsO family protein